MFYSSGIFKFINLAARAFRSFRNFFRSIFANWFGTEISDAEFQKSLLPEYTRIRNFLEHFKAQGSRSFFIEMERKEQVITSLHQVCPDATGNIVNAANKICEHYFDLLGSGPVNLPWPIDWHSDFKTGFRWNPRQYYAQIR